jgi:hypothetical protein
MGSKKKKLLMKIKVKTGEEKKKKTMNEIGRNLDK